MPQREACSVGLDSSTATVLETKYKYEILKICQKF